MQVFAIGDIHGELEKLKEAHRRVARIAGEDATIVHVGDLLDRGPDSRGVVDYLRDGQARGRDWVVIKGNHDRFLPKFLADPDWVDGRLASGRNWVEHEQLGGPATLASYGIDPTLPRGKLHEAAVAAVPASDAAWLAGLPLWHLCPLALFVHAGVRPGVDLSRQTEDDLLWIRPEFLNETRDFGHLVVHGHSVVAKVEHHGNRLAIDTGAVFGGELSVVELVPEGVNLITSEGRAPIHPVPRKA